MLDGDPNPNTRPVALPSSSSSTSTSRQRFYVELKPGETTIVSWKKLLKDAAREPYDGAAPAGAHPALASRIAPEVAKETPQGPLPPPPNRFSSVIERIEKLYQGAADSDHEETPGSFLDDTDKYDTRDSFIDDTELDDYFQVDATKLKHEGFFINRGQLEHQQEVTPSAALIMENPKKKKTKKLGAIQVIEESVKMKSRVRLKEAARSIHAHQLTPPSTIVSKPAKSSHLLKDKKGSDSAVDESSIQTSDHASTLKAMECSDDKETEMANRTGVQGALKPLKEEEMQAFAIAKKTSHPSGKEVGRIKGTVLERALMELEKGVAELCPPSLIFREPENGKRIRLPRDVKQKLAKVARLAAKQGKMTDDFVERLMGILGHMVQVNTLKRHLKAMIEMGMSAMQEKAGRLQGIKEEVTEMIKSRVHRLEAPDVQHAAAGGAGDLQMMDPEKWSKREQYQWDHAMEDKICDLYDQYVEGIDEDKGPHLRKLYAELAELWPEGLMDNAGIKLAVLRAKERKKEASKSTEQKKRRRRSKQKETIHDLQVGEFHLRQHTDLVGHGTPPYSMDHHGNKNAAHAFPNHVRHGDGLGISRSVMEENNERAAGSIKLHTNTTTLPDHTDLQKEGSAPSNCNNPARFAATPRLGLQQNHAGSTSH